ncbi:helix-turn-helix domain-containing protein [Pontibacillus yanchengensis]|uniref:Helix-turn-helix domain-containing protein n=2 Tax=Pontibacillus yanchengensis TaxID=462910 RepID=A0A6I5A5J0_9BACI|nr:helix-turn-helix transcriptional regulator [Pontibacillus yanchengensis]MYL35626.1 helix-turn-helix domain-containing protein [Pontibacillus yanchengensis]MYL53686.1 helix-turn-helix domain-containing protein [Pontibacillus yanchengensis]
MNNVGTTIKALREEHNDTIEELAAKLELNHKDLSGIESGAQTASLQTLRQVALTYDASLSTFIGENPEETDEVYDKFEKWLPFINKMEQKGITPEALIELLDKQAEK